ncbi:MAG: tRNA (pseudouridine(54)-N(1))-methyltransferase TrmY [Pseudomonadales bacterium]|nr:tRNA (pseudouridine(54)-N(1))-methyltransferase TrmY [Pseudomonadales bacterium]
MRAFVIRARSAPTDSAKLLAEVGGDAHAEILAHSLMNAIFVAQSHRSHVQVYLVLESTQDFSRTIHFDSDRLANIGGFHEQAWLAKICKALDASQGLSKEQSVEVEAGLSVATKSFEKLLQELVEDYQVYMMDKKGQAIRDVDFPENVCFLLTDHIPMPKKAYNSFKRLGVEKISLGPTMLFASQCITLIQHELDMAGVQ